MPNLAWALAQVAVAAMARQGTMEGVEVSADRQVPVVAPQVGVVVVAAVAVGWSCRPPSRMLSRRHPSAWQPTETTQIAMAILVWCSLPSRERLCGNGMKPVLAKT